MVRGNKEILLTLDESRNGGHAYYLDIWVPREKRKTEIIKSGFLQEM